MKHLLWILLTLLCLPHLGAQTLPKWKAHDPERPRPRVVTPAPQGETVPPPSDAVMLFNGTGLENWCGEEGGDVSWVVEDGILMPGAKAEDIYTRRPFGDVQLHLEWSAPLPVKGTGQGRGNSGVFLMGLYEVQILDSFENTTYADGQAAAIYGQYPPLVNACRPPGEWQTYDIIFRRPRFTPDGALAGPAVMTVLHNGILVQDAVKLWGPSNWLQYLPYAPHPDKLPLSLQHHGNPVRFRNIWLRELREQEAPGPAYDESPPVITLTPESLDRYVGLYKYSPDSATGFTIRRIGDQLTCIYGEREGRVDLVPHSTTKFSMRWTAAFVEFALGKDGRATAMTLNVSGSAFTVKRVD
jgi:hypothetical protein